jgi:hypothetical protein
MARLVILTVAMMMVASAWGQEAECDSEAFAQLTTKAQTDCGSDQAKQCSAECQADINNILGSAEIMACFAQIGDAGVQAKAGLEQAKAACSSASAVGVAAVSAAAIAALLL